MKEQNYKNHRQVVYSYYVFTGLPILLLIGISIKKLAGSDDSYRDLWACFLLVGWILLTMLFRSRGFALKAQDRAIRAEESLRHYLITGRPVDPRLTLSQIIALRFASDAELPSLSEKAATQGLSNKDIKMEIRNWRPDLQRV